MQAHLRQEKMLKLLNRNKKIPVFFKNQFYKPLQKQKDLKREKLVKREKSQENLSVGLVTNPCQNKSPLSRTYLSPESEALGKRCKDPSNPSPWYQNLARRQFDHSRSQRLRTLERRFKDFEDRLRLKSRQPIQLLQNEKRSKTAFPTRSNKSWSENESLYGDLVGEPEIFQRGSVFSKKGNLNHNCTENSSINLRIKDFAERRSENLLRSNSGKWSVEKNPVKMNGAFRSDFLNSLRPNIVQKQKSNFAKKNYKNSIYGLITPQLSTRASKKSIKSKISPSNYYARTSQILKSKSQPKIQKKLKKLSNYQISNNPSQISLQPTANTSISNTTRLTFITTSNSAKSLAFNPNKKEEKNPNIEKIKNSIKSQKERLSINSLCKIQRQKPSKKKSSKILKRFQTDRISQKNPHKEPPFIKSLKQTGACLDSKPFTAYTAQTNKGLVRDYNEDRVSIILNIVKESGQIDPACSYFSLFDGHAGSFCADFLRDRLHQFITSTPLFDKDKEAALRAGILKAEEEFLREAMSMSKPDISGSCVLIALLTSESCYLGNVGDSRAILSKNGGDESNSVTRDHKPELDYEKERILQAGGKIYRKRVQMKSKEKNNKGKNEEKTFTTYGPYRVDPGGLSVSRTIGDFPSKHPAVGGNPKCVVACPDIYKIEISPELDFLLLGCDGIFDYLSTEEVVGFVWQVLRKELGKRNLKEVARLAAEYIMKKAFDRKASDNLTVVLVFFKGQEELGKCLWRRERELSKGKENRQK